MSLSSGSVKIKGIVVFTVSFFSMLLIFIPDIIRNNGVFLFAGDYIFQQIPFYLHAADIVQNYGIGWDWFTDLGSDFITSYSYYLTGSAFFWLIAWLPRTMVLYAMPVMIALKTAIASIGAYYYIKMYVSNDRAAFIGAYMYAFSGFQMTGLVFNTFHEVTAFFPFLLISFDLLVKKEQKCCFAIMTAIVALDNYFFFFGIAVFVFIYYIVRIVKKDFNFSLKNFGLIFVESVIGTGISMIILYPTLVLLLGADRIDNVLCGVDLVSYSDNTIVPKILQSLFLIPDPPSGAMLFLSEENSHNWASISLYLPVFTITGVCVFVKQEKKSWISTTLFVCAVFALVPGLNSIFSMMNDSYYARWFFMPVLLMCLATAKALDLGYDMKSGMIIQGTGMILLGLVSFFPNKVIAEDDQLNYTLGHSESIQSEIKMFSMSAIPVVFWQCMAFAGIYLLVIYIYNQKKNDDDRILKKISVSMVALVVITYVIFINNTISSTGINQADIYRSSLSYTPDIDDDSVFRVSHANTYSSNNYSMLWGYMNAGCFHSVEVNETDDFYYGIQGKERMMASQYDESDYPVYGLLSVKYIFNISTGDDLNVELDPVKIKGFSLYDKQDCYYIYKNDYFIPFGYMYNYYIDDKTLNDYLNENVSEEDKYQYKKLVMMRALVLDDAEASEYSSCIKKLPGNMLDSLDENTYYDDCTEKSEHACSNFEYNASGFSADISADCAGIVYFSVPCSDGWSAKVNGNDIDVIKVNYGMCAVPVDSGYNKIEFSYTTPGLKTGKTLSFISSVILAGYSLYVIVSGRKKKTVLKEMR